MASAEPVEHGGDAVEELLAHLHLRAAHVAPRDGDAERGADLRVGARGGGVASDASTALVAGTVSVTESVSVSVTDTDTDTDSDAVSSQPPQSGFFTLNVAMSGAGCTVSSF